MTEYVDLFARRNRGWPWPEDSLGLDPVYGSDGWCRTCGVPRHEQNGNLILQRRGLTASGAWAPNWQFDAICIDAAVQAELATVDNLEFRPIRWPRDERADAYQIIAPTVGDRWFDAELLRERVEARHGGAGKACPECGVWKWLPILWDRLPPMTAALGDLPVAASPEYFGDGLVAFRQMLVRRDVACVLVASSPRDFKLAPVRL